MTLTDFKMPHGRLVVLMVLTLLQLRISYHGKTS